MATQDSTLTADYVRNLFDYDPESGVFRHRTTRSSRALAGAVAGCLDDRYVRIGIDGRIYSAHRLAFLWVTGQWPVYAVDHVDGDGSNNRWSNLRDVSPRVNAQNKRAAMSNNKTGFLGVFKRGDKPNYKAQIKADGKLIYLGTFATAEDAHAAYLAAKRKLHVGNTL